jgi:hypothetical protein
MLVCRRAAVFGTAAGGTLMSSSHLVDATMWFDLPSALRWRGSRPLFLALLVFWCLLVGVGPVAAQDHEIVFAVAPLGSFNELARDRSVWIQVAVVVAVIGILLLSQKYR